MSKHTPTMCMFLLLTSSLLLYTEIAFAHPASNKAELNHINTPHKPTLGILRQTQRGYHRVEEKALKQLAKYAENLEKIYFDPIDSNKPVHDLPLVKTYELDGIVKWSDYFVD